MFYPLTRLSAAFGRLCANEVFIYCVVLVFYHITECGLGVSQC